MTIHAHGLTNVMTVRDNAAAMAYRPALHGPRGSWGRFLDQMRRERDWSAVQAHEALHGVLRLSIKSVAVYKAIEHGTRSVRPDEAEALTAYFGKGPSDDAPATTEPQDALVVALTRQAEATEKLVGRIDALLISRDQDLRDLAQTLASLLASPATRRAAGASGAARAESKSPGQ